MGSSMRLVFVNQGIVTQRETPIFIFAAYGAVHAHYTPFVFVSPIRVGEDSCRGKLNRLAGSRCVAPSTGVFLSPLSSKLFFRKKNIQWNSRLPYRILHLFILYNITPPPSTRRGLKVYIFWCAWVVLLYTHLSAHQSRRIHFLDRREGEICITHTCSIVFPIGIFPSRPNDEKGFFFLFYEKLHAEFPCVYARLERSGRAWPDRQKQAKTRFFLTAIYF